MVGDSAVLDYLRANDPGCTLAHHGEDLVSDTFAISMGKGFPLRVKINTILARYLASGHLDHLKHKWYGELPCFNRISADLYKPQALEISTVGGVFLMLTLGIGVGIFLLFLEHLVYRYALPTLRTKPKESLWRNRNLMFFSQKLYKFINCVELVSPHHSAKELANSLRTGQIMGLFQKSVKRKENEQRRRRKSKAQFFEMIQEIRRVQKEERAEQIHPPPTSATSTTVTVDSRRGEPTPSLPSHPPEVTPAPPSPFSATTITTTQAPITIDYLPGPNPHEDSEGIIVVNSSVPLGLMEEVSSRIGAREEAGREDDSGSGILILKVSDPEEILEANTFNQQLEDTQTYKLQGALGECEVCTCSVQEGGANRRKASGGCLNCLQRQDSARIGRRPTDGTCYPCSSVTSARENPLSAYPIVAGTANGLRHRGSVPNPTSHLPSPSLRPATAPSTATPSPGVVQQTDVPEILGCGTRSLEDLEARTRHSLGEKSYESVRLVPLSEQTAIKSSGSLQLVAALSPGRERVNSDLLRHVTKADLWQLWQDSEKELRVRLRQAESQRDELLRQMSKASHRDRHTLTEGSSEEWDNKSLEDTRGEAKKTYVAVTPVSRRTEDMEDFPRSARRMSRERHPDETRLKNSRRDSSTTPRKKKRQRSKSHDYLETRKSSESVEEKKLYPKSEERVTPRKHTNRRKRDGSQDRRTESEEGPCLPRQRAHVHRSFEDPIDSTDLVDPLSEYCSTPLPLLRSLHQQSKSDAERNYAFLQSLTPERREERLPHDTYSDHIHLKTFCREIKGRGCESDEQIEDDSRLKKSEEEKLSIRRRRAGHHGVGGHVEVQTRRPRERLPSRELYEGPHRRESSLQRDTRQSLPRRQYEREARDHSSPYSGSHRQQQQQQHGVRRHTTYDSSSDQEEAALYSAVPSLEASMTCEAHGRRQPSQHPYPRTYEGRRPGDRIEDRRSSERKTFRETREPP